MSTEVITETSTVDSRLPLCHDIGETAGTRASTPLPSIRSLAGVSDGQRGITPSASTSIRELQIPNEDPPDVNPELKLPPLKSLFIVLAGNALFQFSFFIVVSSASVYAERLGGSAVFAGLTIGIPAVVSAIALVFIDKYNQKNYVRPFNIAYAAMILGNLLYASASVADFLYLILIGRIVAGFGFTSFMFTKRYCSDPRIVGVRRRTTLASWAVLGQGIGFSAGPFLGGLLYKVGFSNKVFNGYTSPGWITAGVWVLFWALSRLMFEEVVTPKDTLPLQITVTQRTEETFINASSAGFSSYFPRDETTISASPPQPTEKNRFRDLDKRQLGVVVCMCYYAMTCFFVLASWEANIPVFSAAAFNYSPFQAGNFIALGGVATLPFLLLNIRFSRRFQDRTTLATGYTLGLAGLLIMLVILHTGKLHFGSFFVCWFLVALGFNLASTCTLSLLSKQLQPSWNGKISMGIQYGNYTGRVTGAILGGAGVKIGMLNYIGIQIAVVGLGGIMHLTLWRELKAKTG
ncbi:MFS general substrate transporter [Macrolepiota fuliginosa MF-IS2]|uniref:MFS general substrate transporter n=1 Tax=Macrolepiota fuliginosa MF-IS2 TaxID=1400762 RepID=A0A9P5X8H0_9AGAR|nr:MFS general substrate transporter [Macrolepiota fuliginosa MF-IS2]